MNWENQAGFFAHPNGFIINFPNGYAASVRWGSNNYCSAIDNKDGVIAASTAEATAYIWRGESGHFLSRIPHRVEGFDYGGDDVLGWLTPNQVSEFISKVAALPYIVASNR